MKLVHLFAVPVASASVIKMQQHVAIPAGVGIVTTDIMQLTAQKVTNEIAPSIGIHFATSYAVAATRYRNGTVQDLVRVAGSAEYIDLMTRWTN
jgi:hypothetical protein